MIFISIFTGLVLIVIILTLIPIQLKIDTTRGIYQLQWKRLLKANLLFRDSEPIASLKILFWKKDIYLLRIKLKDKTKSKAKASKKEDKEKSKFKFRKKLKRLFNSIQVKQFFLNIDTDEYIWNAYLYPIFFFLRKEKRDIHINFRGEQQLILDIQTRPIKILHALIF